jgi:hypothetical protein
MGGFRARSSRAPTTLASRLKMLKRDRERRIREETDSLLKTCPEGSLMPPDMKREIDRIVDRMFKRKGPAD